MFLEAPARLAKRRALRRGTAGAGLAEDDERPEIDSAAALEAWLKDKPAEWAQAIAVRAALRVFPLALGVYYFPEVRLLDRHLNNITLKSFRVAFSSYAAEMNYDSKVLFCLNEANRQYLEAVHTSFFSKSISVAFECSAESILLEDGAYSSRVAAKTLVAVKDVVDGYSIAANYNMRLGGGMSDIWRAVSEDCLWLLTHEAAPALNTQPLWPRAPSGHVPSDTSFMSSVRELMDRFSAEEEVKNGPWGLIVDWYRAILPEPDNARPRSLFGETADIAIASQPNEFWTITEERSAEDILEEIAEIGGYEPSHPLVGSSSLVATKILRFLEAIRRPATVEEIHTEVTASHPDRTISLVRRRLGALEQSSRVVRTSEGLYVHPDWANDHTGPDNSDDGGASFAHDVDQALQNVEAQAPAAYRFRWQDNRLEAAPPADIASDPEGAQILLDETRRKAEFLAERLERSNADKRVLTSVQGLLSVLPENVADLRPALLRSRARSVEADAQAYSSPGDEEQFLYPDALAALIDLSETARDLQGYFPSLRELEAEITALAIEPSQVEAVKARLDEIVDEAAGHPEVVGPSAVEALRTMEALATEPAPPAVRQKRIADYALVVRNSISSVARVALDNAFTREAKQLASDIYDKARAKVVDGIADGVGAMARPATIIAIAALIGGIFGPVAGIAAAAAGFGKVDRLLKLADKWLEKWEKENAPADTAKDDEDDEDDKDAEAGVETDDDA